MTAAATSRPQAPRASKGKLTYRGVTLQHPATRSRFSIAEIRKAVESAIAENADALSKRK
ncbi:MAG: hypothetical protein JWP35_1865 [Caulobacter sp.]|nr:hypothetical protein [Caulobacter sp.]